MPKEELKKTRVICKDGKILIKGKCVKLDYDSKTKDVKLSINKDCPEDTKIAYSEIGNALSGEEGRLDFVYESWDEEEPEPKKPKKA